jgi:hypothetical protein
MTTHALPPATSYEVALAGSIGPAYLAALGTAGPHSPRTTSLFLLPGSSGVDLCEVVAMLQAKGLQVLQVRLVDSPSAVRGSSPAGDAPEQRQQRP